MDNLLAPSRLIVGRWMGRAVTVAAALLLYYRLDWLALRVVMRDILVVIFTTIEPSARAVGGSTNPALALGGRYFAVTRNCVYVDVALVLCPILWRPASALAPNIVRTACVVVAALAFNLTRTTVAILLFSYRDVSWRVVHFWPDYIFHVVVIFAACGVALWRDNLEMRTLS